MPTRSSRARGSLSARVRGLVTLGVLFLALLLARRADAYPWMIRHDYATCSTCHADPSGAGIMTAYGRAQTEVLLRTRYGSPREDEDPAKLGSFMFGLVPLPEQLQLQGDLRTLLLRVSPPSPAAAVNRVIVMQADAAASVAVGAFRAAGSLGYVHEGALGASVTRGAEDRLVSRQHWAGAVFGSDDAFLVRAGRMNLPFGLRVLEHTLLARQATRSDVNAAQQHGVALSWNQEGWRAEVMGIVGNFQVRPDDLRDRGGAGYLEHAFSQRFAAGVTSMVTHARRDLEVGHATFRQAHGLFGRWAVAKPVVLMAESDLIVRSPTKMPIEVGSTGFLQVDVEPTQGVHVAGTAEFLTQRFGDPATLGGWLSAFWFFLPHLDVRADVVARSVAVGDRRETVLSYLAQIHGFL